MLSLIISLLLDIPNLQFSDFEISDNWLGAVEMLFLRMQSWKCFIQLKTLETSHST